MKYYRNYTKEEANSTGVYKITNLENNKFYIGSSVNMRKRKSQLVMRQPYCGATIK